MLESMLWTEAYRPSTLEEVGLDPRIREQLGAFIEAGEFPHLLLEGPPGCGKTTVAKILTSTIDCSLLTLNASAERGIDVIRDRVRDFCSGLMGADWNVVFLDEADALTQDAQTALRNVVETYAKMSRFIFTCNYLHKIIPAIQSRCVVIGMGQIPVDERYRILKSVLDAEGVEYDPKDAFSYAELFTDMRQVLNRAQASVLQHHRLLPVSGEDGVTGASIFEACTKGQRGWKAVKNAARNPALDHATLLRELFWAVPDDLPNAATLRVIIARAVAEAPRALDPVVHFAGTCAELIQELKRGR